jgi:hypothetical protein
MVNAVLRLFFDCLVRLVNFANTLNTIQNALSADLWRIRLSHICLHMGAARWVRTAVQAGVLSQTPNLAEVDGGRGHALWMTWPNGITLLHAELGQYFMRQSLHDRAATLKTVASGATPPTSPGAIVNYSRRFKAGTLNMTERARWLIRVARYGSLLQRKYPPSAQGLRKGETL